MTGPTSNMKVLIVDDTDVSLKLLRVVLEAENISVVEAKNGLEALEILGRDKVDAIISDILMPQMDGYRLCYEVRRNDELQELPFIFYTATYLSESDEKLCYDLGADKYLRKPAPAEAVLAALTAAANRAGRSMPRRIAFLTETDVMKEYSERLVSKLESRNVELAQAKEHLEETNRQLTRQAEELERARAELQQTNQELDDRVRQRTKELEASNMELEAFSYSVSHDLRAPLRHIGSYADLILKSSTAHLDEINRLHLQALRKAVQKMGGIIEALLELTRVTHNEIHWVAMDLSALAREVFAELQEIAPGRAVQLEVAPGLTAKGDPRLLRVALTNLLGNALKFTSKRADARIQFGKVQNGVDCAYFVRDNGAGFDMAYAEKLFGAFQRLHSQADFQGTGIGLATVQRIIHRHNGKTWAESAPGRGATFYFTLGGGVAKDSEHPVKRKEEAQ
jgi:signal transduction histidine kinase